MNVSDVIVALNGGKGEPFRDRSPAFPEMGKTGADGMGIGGGREMVLNVGLENGTENSRCDSEAA